MSPHNSKPESNVEPAIDELYQLPVDDFTAARNALAKTLSGADAARVRTLVKPTAVPWAVNQLYWIERRVFDRLRKSGERLRNAQIAALKGTKGASADVRGAADQHRHAIADAASHAARLAEAAGSRLGALGTPANNDLTRMLEALSLAAELPEAPGRFTRPLQPAGFEALSGIPVAASLTTSMRATEDGAKKPRVEKGRPEEARGEKEREQENRNEAARREAEARAEAEARVAEAEATRDRAAAAEAHARTAWERAKRELELAGEALERARSRLSTQPSTSLGRTSTTR